MHSSGVLTKKERVRSALAEMGFPNAEVSGPDNKPRVLIGNGPTGVPNWACSRAFSSLYEEDYS